MFRTLGHDIPFLGIENIGFGQGYGVPDFTTIKEDATDIVPVPLGVDSGKRGRGQRGSRVYG